MTPADQGTPLVPSAAAEVLLAFVNTRPLDGHAERLADGGTTLDWLRETEPAAAGPTALVTDADAAAARELREALVGILLAHAGEPGGTAEPEARLRHSAEQFPVLAVVSADGVRLVPVRTGLAGVLAGVLAAASELALAGLWPRLKACRNCRWGFYDRTRNLSATYCDPRRCGARVAMRSYRARNAAVITQGSTEHTTST